MTDLPNSDRANDEPTLNPVTPRTPPPTISELFGSQLKPRKQPLGTRITLATATRLEVLKKSGVSTTAITEIALTRLLDDLGVPHTDSNDRIVEP